MAVSFADAIALFENTLTGKGQAGPDLDGAGKLGPLVVTKLKQLHRIGWIEFATLPSDEVGEVANGRLRISQAFNHDVVAVALIAVHEAAHAVIPWKDTEYYVDGEVRCRRLEISFYEELLAARRLPAQGRQARELEKQKELAKKDQLIDFVLSMKQYADQVKPRWIKRTIREQRWRGLGNRWPSSKRLFVHVLAGELPVPDAEMILEILHSSLDKPLEFTSILPLKDHDPDMIRIRKALATGGLMAKPEARRRLEQVEKRSGRSLGLPVSVR